MLELFGVRIFPATRDFNKNMPKCICLDNFLSSSMEQEVSGCIFFWESPCGNCNEKTCFEVLAFLYFIILKCWNTNLKHKSSLPYVGSTDFFFLNILSTSKGKKYQNFPLKYKMSMWPHSHCETVSVESSSNFQNSLKTFFLVTLTPQHFSEQRSTYLLHHTVEPPLFLL